MVQVLDELYTQTCLEWRSAESGDEVFVTLSRKDDVATMTPTASTHFKRPPGTIAFVHHETTRSVTSMKIIIQITCVD